MVGAGATSVCTLRAVSLWCTNSLSSNPVFSQFPSGLRGDKVGLSWAQRRCSWLVSVPKNTGSFNRRWHKAYCTLDSSGHGNAPSRAFGIPVLDRDENGNIVIRQKSAVRERLSTRSAENEASSSKLGTFKPTTAQSSKPTSTTKVKDNNRGKAQVPKTLSTGTSKDTSNSRITKDIANARRVSRVKATTGPPQYSKAARRFYNEKFRQPERLSKVLAAAGVASRRGSEEIIFAGRVSVNGNICLVPQTPVDPLIDLIYVDGNSLPKKVASKMYFALNKPKGYICSNGGEGTKPVLSLFDDYFKIWSQRNPGLSRPRMFTVGRLDVATSGLLLVTNDGEFGNKVSHPSSGLTKEYVVTLEEKASRRQLTVIAAGTVVQGVKCVPALVEAIEMEPGDIRQRIRIVVSEGRNHEVRHLVENAGLKVVGLKRIRIGGLRLSRKLGVGKFEVLTDAQVAKVLDKNAQNSV